jgi:hypothetical protein
LFVFLELSVMKPEYNMQIVFCSLMWRKAKYLYAHKYFICVLIHSNNKSEGLICSYCVQKMSWLLDISE